ncbi:hypothetical protein PMU02_06970 [Enterococcus faecalis]|nr:hypothetical protein [Enterococcus faecalis]EKZ0520099.1 hypothetical protein [Enterococcus faecalis]MBP4098110.1 hypothetical protein [Enterococcus faecalis]MDB1612658.1 hypothetical protein [Enterococcus faecalis]MDB1620929.1 hypothetical protein [Enterococcus faecalis]NSW17793.1 hypothetical protein [Enterococcus faecalis]
MKTIQKYLVTGCCGLVLGVSGTVTYAQKVLLPKQTEQVQQSQEKTTQLEKELEELKKQKVGQPSKEIPIEKHSYSHQEYENLKAIGEQFRAGYYDINTDTAEKKLATLKEIVTPNLSKKLRPAWVDDYKTDFRIDQETASEQYYVKLNGVTGKAVMIGCLLVTTKHGNGAPFDVKYIDRFTLEKDKNNHWKIKEFTEQVAPRDLPNNYFMPE